MVGHSRPRYITWEWSQGGNSAQKRGKSTVQSSGALTEPNLKAAKKQPQTTYSSTATEIFAYSEAVKDARLIQFRLSELGVNLTLPLMIQVDNRGVQSFAKGSGGCGESD